MNYQNFTSYNNFDPGYGKKYHIYDDGTGVNAINKNNMTEQDLYRTPFLFIQDHPNDYKNLASIALKGIQSDSELSKIYFSEENMRRLQKQIKKEVFKRTRGQFRLDVDQDPKDLFIIMRAVYFEHAKNMDNKIIHQVKRLNAKVIESSLPDIITAIKQEYGYIKEINKPLQPMMRPINVNHAGRKTLPSLTTIFN